MSIWQSVYKPQSYVIRYYVLSMNVGDIVDFHRLSIMRVHTQFETGLWANLEFQNFLKEGVKHYAYPVGLYYTETTIKKVKIKQVINLHRA